MNTPIPVWIFYLVVQDPPQLNQTAAFIRIKVISNGLCPWFDGNRCRCLCIGRQFAQLYSSHSSIDDFGGI